MVIEIIELDLNFVGKEFSSETKSNLIWEFDILCSQPTKEEFEEAREVFKSNWKQKASLFIKYCSSTYLDDDARYSNQILFSEISFLSGINHNNGLNFQELGMQ